jgi:AcrR family transcriptional regulator
MDTPTADGRTAQARRAATDSKLLQAAQEILRTDGVGAVTIEAVAARSGVAKTTIYRRYADRRALLRATLDTYLPAITVLDSQNPRHSLVCAARMLSTAIERCIGTAFAASLHSQQNPAASIIRERVVQPHIDALSAFLRACVAAGHLRADIDDSIIIDMLVGSVGAHFARFGAFDEQWPERFIAHLWPAIAATGPAAAGTPQDHPAPTPTATGGRRAHRR